MGPSEAQLPQEIEWPPGPVTGAVDDIDIHRLAETFAVTPEAVRMAVARVGTSFREVQRELGGRR